MPFIERLKFTVLGTLSTTTAPTPYPKENPTQYWFGTRSLPYFTRLRPLWYRWDEAKGDFIKIIPLKLVIKYFDAITLAFWIMGDGYWDTDQATILLCTENFTHAEVAALIELLRSKEGIVATPRKRGSNLRIRISSRSIDLLRRLVRPHMHPA